MKSRLVMIVTGISIFGFSLFGVSEIAKQITESKNDHQLSAHMKLGSSPRPVEGWVEYMAEYDFIGFSPGAWDKPQMEGMQEEIQRLNLDMQFGSYISAFACNRWTKIAYEQGQDTYIAHWWEELSPFLAATTEGDTAAIWKDAYVYDLFNPVARTKAITLMDGYIRRNNLDWIMLDFVSVPLPNLKASQDPIYEEMEHGDLDFDRDGIGHWDDPDERAALRVIWDLYIEEMVATFPKNLKIIPNGSLAIKDADFAKRVHGCYVEGFPQWFFGTSASNFPNAYDEDFQNSLWILSENDRWRNGEGFVMIEDRYYRNTYGYVSKIFDGVVEMRRQLGDGPYTGDYVTLPLELDTGAPLGPPETIGSEIIRAFEKGSIRIGRANTSNPIYYFDELEAPAPKQTP